MVLNGVESKMIQARKINEAFAELTRRIEELEGGKPAAKTEVAAKRTKKEKAEEVVVEETKADDAE